MRKNKYAYIIIIIVLCTLAAGYNSLLEKKKPVIFYYTDLLSKDIKQENTFLGIVLDTNYYKEQTLSKDDNQTVKNFIGNLHKENFIGKPKDLPDKPSYKMYFTFKSDKYVIDVYNEKYLSIYPWDGTYPEDYITMDGIPNSCNLYALCKYVIPRH